jgi:DNA-binding NtrC family response regulator
MSQGVQAKLLRFLQDREVIPVGATGGRTVNVKIIAATSRAQAGAGSPLRADVLARLGAEPVNIPPLRERIEDLGSLLRHFLGERGPVLQTEAFRALCLYGFPRNVRELEKIAERAAALTDDGEIRVDHLPAAVRAAQRLGPPIAVRRRPRSGPSREALMAEHGGNVTAVARALDRQWNVVWRWLVKYRLSPQRHRSAGPDS